MTISAIPTHFWLRDEVKPGERRTPILPEHAAQLIAAGHRVTVEASKTRCVATEKYEQVGCQIAPSGSWRTLAPEDAIILGLKELEVEVGPQNPESSQPLQHRHVYFAHCYKNQNGWQELLTRFIDGKGSLLDLEFLTHENGARVAAFGRSAGFIGMGVGILNWIHQQEQSKTNNNLTTQQLLGELQYFDDFDHLVGHVSALLKNFERKPKVLVIGALGRCGKGAVDLAERVGLTPTQWDLAETSRGGPFPELVDYDILVNCIYLSQKIQPFLTLDIINQAKTRQLSTVVDVSCDFTNPNNPLPIYNDGTTFPNPSMRVLSEGTVPLDVVAIDHLPTLVPFDSSKEFADLLIEHLRVVDNSNVWTRARELFVNKCALATQQVPVPQSQL